MRRQAFRLKRGQNLVSETHLLSTEPIIEDQMITLAQKFAQALKADDFVLLEGTLGAGKTSFARAIIRELLNDREGQEHIPSPTFTLVQTYETEAFDILHADLYRLSDPSEALELGLLEDDVPKVSIIEWPDRLGSLRPSEALTITFDITDDRRTLSFSSSDKDWRNRLGPLA